MRALAAEPQVGATERVEKALEVLLILGLGGSQQLSSARQPPRLPLRAVL